MPKRKKRKPDLRHVRPTKTYTVTDIAEALDRNVATVHRWIRTGLPTLDRQKPTLILGADLLDWLKTQWSRRKRKCRPNELYCFGCRSPRLPKPGTASVQPRNDKAIAIKALCSKCGSRMNRAASRSQRAEAEANFGPFMPEMERIVRCDEVSATDTERRSQYDHASFANDEAQVAMDFNITTVGSFDE